MKDFGKEFDEAVIEYNDWFATIENSTIFSRIINVFRYHPPLYSRKDLSPEQKDAIAIASDWKTVGSDLEQLLENDQHQIQLGKEIERAEGRVWYEKKKKKKKNYKKNF